MLQRFLDASVLAGISGLDLVAKTVVDGFVAGLHRLPDFGFSPEFAEFRAYIRPSTRQGQFVRPLSGLEHAEPHARTDFAKPLHHFQQFLRRRGIVVFISDFYESAEQVVRTIEPLRFHGNEVVLFHILDPKEIRPDFREPATLVDLETQERAQITPYYVLDARRQ